MMISLKIKNKDNEAGMEFWKNGKRGRSGTFQTPHQLQRRSIGMIMESQYEKYIFFAK